MAFAPTKQVSGLVVIVDIDNSSLARFGQWPWSRDLLAQLLETINSSGAAVIGLDLLLAEPDRTSAAVPEKNSNIKSGSKAVMSGVPSALMDNDTKLASTLSKGSYVLGYEFLFGNRLISQSSFELHPPGVVWVNIPDEGLSQTDFFKAQAVVSNRLLFSKTVTHSGFMNATPDNDGILRRLPMLIRYDGTVYPSLSMAMLMKYSEGNQVEIRQQDAGLLDIKVGTRSLQIDTQGNMIVRFLQQADLISTITAEMILDGKYSPQQLNGKIVLVGSSAAGLDQVYQTPVMPIHSHVGVHAQALDNLLTGQLVVRTKIVTIYEVLFSLLFAAITALLVARWGIIPAAAMSVSLMAICWIGAVFLFKTKSLLFSPLLPTTLIILNYSLLTIVKTWKIQQAAIKETESTLILLKSSEKTLDSIIKTVPDIIFRLDSTGCITFISPAITRYTDSSDSLIGHSIFELVAPEDLEKAQHRLNEKRTGKRATRSLELRLILPQKQGLNAADTGYFSVSAEGIYKNDAPNPGEFIGTQGILRDITEQKKMEEKLLQARKLEAIGSLAAGVAHDLNNILAGLVTYPDLLLLELPKDSPLREKIAIIQQSGKNAAAIVQDMLTLGRRGVKTGEVVDLNVIVSDYNVSLEFEAIMKYHPKTVLELDLAPDLLKVMGSRSHLAKAIMNLLNNAAEAMPAGGKITLSTYNKFLDNTIKLYEEIPPGEYVCISVQDEGVGISSEDIQRIFEPFYSKKSMKRSGSGLGMTVIWATVKDLGGYIDIQSTEGEGALFELYLPATRNEAAMSTKRNVLEDYIGTESIVIVDDMPEQLLIATKMLTKLGYSVASFASGEAVVDYLCLHNADLVVLDMIMPGGMDGLDTYIRINEIHPGQKTIITSGYAESDRVAALQKLGAGAYVQKPYTLEKLGLAVRKELDRSSFARIKMD